MIVADASALIALVIGDEPDGGWVIRQIGDTEIVSTELMPAEVSNTLRRMELRRELSPEAAVEAYRQLLYLRPELFSFTPFAARVWALRRNLTCYDAWYVALAEALGCPLVTTDHRLSRATGPECAFVTPPGA